ncbi:MAG: class I SAM-dependent methyltransferase [Vicinamibacteria bacterium]
MNSTAEAEFEKYAQLGAYHWRDIGGHWIYHNAFNAERYRRVLRAAAPLAGFRVLDYGCGDGALLGWISRAVGSNGEAVGLEPNEEGRAAARHMLSRHSLPARLCASPQELESGSFDRVICSEVIEHVADVEGLLRDIHRVLKPDGLAVLTTPIRLTEVPEEPSHVREWFPSEFAALFEAGPFHLRRHEQVIPSATTEVFFWRPRFLLRIPVFRVLCNVLSIYGGIDSLSWLAMRPRLFMTQLVMLEKRAIGGPEVGPLP